MSKILAAELERTIIRLYTSATLRYPPLPAYYELMILFDFHAPSVKSFNRKRRHIGMRIFIRIIYHTINGYPDSKLSVLSIPTPWPPSYSSVLTVGFVFLVLNA